MCLLLLKIRLGYRVSGMNCHFMGPSSSSLITLVVHQKQITLANCLFHVCLVVITSFDTEMWNVVLINVNWDV